MGVSLVTIIGRGVIGKDTYKKTRYEFPDGSISEETTIFSKALIEKYKGNLDSIIVVGTETSSWSAILPDSELEDEDSLAWKLYSNEAEKIPISAHNLEELEVKLKEIYHCSVHILPPQKPDISQEEDELEIYSEVASYIKGSELILDITSGFRYMSMLLFQNLQSFFPSSSGYKVTMLYAEYDENLSHVRNMTSVWRAAEVNKALVTFKTTFNGVELIPFLKEKGYIKLAEWIGELSTNISRNYIMAFDKVFFVRLKNLLSKEFHSIKLIKSPFVRETIIFLRDSVVSKFDFQQENLSYYLLNFARILNEKQLFTQAIIALRESLFTCIFENCDSKQVGKYINMKDLNEKPEKNYYPEFKNICSEKYGKEFCNSIRDLNKLRNSIAHAGADRVEEKPDMVEKKLSENFDEYYNCVQIVYDEFNKKDGIFGYIKEHK